jgi:hypothetical protein
MVAAVCGPGRPVGSLGAGAFGAAVVGSLGGVGRVVSESEA